jgi:hypothetical protein
MRATTAERARSSVNPYVVSAIAWAIPGAGHLLLGRRQKAIVFFVALLAMFAVGLWLRGRLFPFDFTQPIVALMAFADLGIGAAYLISKAMSLGAGDVVAQSYEYGNTFIIVAGLLNMLTMLDAFDIALGRK